MLEPARPDDEHTLALHRPDNAHEAEAALWARWRQNGDLAARQELIAHHLPYARIVAAKYYSNRYHNEVEFDEYFQLASLGLVEALDRFDPTMGVQFRTFASRRIQGSILDGLERSTEKQQQIAMRQRVDAQRREIIKQTLGERSASRTPEQMLKYVAEAGLAFALGWLLDGTGMLDTGECTEDIPFYKGVAMREFRAQLLDLVEDLPAQERMVIRNHYLQEVSFEEIATAAGLTRGRISQIHRAALNRLRDAVAASGACDLFL
jgi:RNA polymerase sigma factor for flagellar operon FliA